MSLPLQVLVRRVFIALTAVTVLGCAEQTAAPPVATPALELGVTRAALGSPIEMRFRFAVAGDAPPFAVDYRVLVHFVDANGRLMWALDHDPPTPTTAWRPGQVVTYTHTEFLPVYPYVGPATVQVGLYDEATGARLPLAGDDTGQREYRVATVELVPEAAGQATVFEEGWQAPEITGSDPPIEWRWSRQDAIAVLPNPGGDAVLFLDLDQPGTVFDEPQQVTLTLGEDVLDRFTLEPGRRELRRIPVTAAALGGAATSRLGIHVDKTFVPATLAPGASSDARELGVRVFHLVLQPPGE